ncbi:unnamed protein product [Calypogeia fissa]
MIPEMEEPKGYKEWREREKNYLEFWEDITHDPLLEQERVLEHILSKNADTEYLRKHDLDGATDVTSFRERLPVSDYNVYKDYIDRIYAGDNSPLLTADPCVEFLTSSGTSGGLPKLFPITNEDLELRGLVWSLMRPLLNRALPGLEKGKVMFFYFMRKAQVSPGGLLCNTAVASFINCSAFKDRPFDPSYILTSPDAITEGLDTNEAMYCHLLLGLLQREEVVRFGAIFAPLIVKALRSLEDLWPDLSSDITSGTLSSKIKDESMRAAVLPFLRKDPKLAEFLREEFSTGKSTDGMIRRLWPNVKVLDTVCTGSLEAYLPALANYSENLPVICTNLYAATEGYFGVNANPMCPSDKIYYTLMPSAAYYEFIAVSADHEQKLDPTVDEILDLTSLKEGQEYEVLVTTVSGLYRYRMGDILKVVGFYNSAPTFQFMRRMNIILTVGTDKTDEQELHTAVCQGTKVLETELGLRLHEYTSTVDFSSKPGHYVVFWELIGGSQAPTQEVLEQCCSAMEGTLNFIYRRDRHDNSIGPLELRLVQAGTFDLLVNHALSCGTTLAQYKTPRCIGPQMPKPLEILNSRVVHKAFCKDKPPFTPGIFRSSLSGRSSQSPRGSLRSPRGSLQSPRGSLGSPKGSLQSPRGQPQFLKELESPREVSMGPLSLTSASKQPL